MEPEGSLPLSPVHIVSQINPVHAPIPLLEDPFLYYPFIYACVSQVASFPQISPPKACVHLSFTPYALHALHISFLLDLSTRILFGEEYSSLSSSLCSLLHSPVTSSPLRLKYTAQHHNHKLPRPTFLSLCERPSFSPIQNNRKNYSYVYHNLYIFG